MTQAGATSSAMISSGRPDFVDQRDRARLVLRLIFWSVIRMQRIVQHHLHPLDVGHHVMRQIAAIERHALDHVQRRLDGGAEFDGDDAVIGPARSKRFGHHRAERGIIGGDAGDGAQVLAAGQRPRPGA